MCIDRSCDHCRSGATVITPSWHERQEADGCHRAPPQMRFADRT
jgi:hypothetical protein